MREVYYSARAEADIWTTAEWLLNNVKPDIARRFVVAVETELQRLCELPGLGHRYIHDASVRAWLIPDFKQYWILYRETPQRIEVIRVFGSSDDLADQFSS